MAITSQMIDQLKVAGHYAAAGSRSTDSNSRATGAIVARLMQPASRQQGTDEPMPRMNRLSPYATTIASDGDKMRVTYHQTVIVEWDDKTITLRTGGWDSVTTRRKMNQAARQFGLGYTVYREKGESYVGNRLGGVPLQDVMVLDRQHYGNRG